MTESPVIRQLRAPAAPFRKPRRCAEPDCRFLTVNPPYCPEHDDDHPAQAA